MSKKSYRQAINEAIRQEMERDPRVIIMGEDISGGTGTRGDQDAWARLYRAAYPRLVAFAARRLGDVDAGREAVSETAGLYNTVGFNDDTRAYPSIPARHDLARRVDANWLAGLVVREVVDMEDALEMAHAAAYSLAKAAYRL